MANFCSEKLTKLYNNEELIAISDSVAILDRIKSEYTEKYDTACKFSTTEVQPDFMQNDKGFDYDIFENDDDHDYGYSEICKKDNNVWDITMYQNRIDAKTDEPFDEYMEEFCEDSKSTWDDNLEIKGVIASHLEYWMQRDTLIPENVPAFRLNREETKCLLCTGFEAERVFIIYE